MATNGESSDADTRKRAKAWTESEEISLIQLVLDKEDMLFGELRGCGVKSIHRQRSDGWEEIASEMNRRYMDAKRDGAGVKKKYFNLRQSAKDKIDAIRASRYRTGERPAPPQLNAADEALAQSMEGRPGMHGISNAIDTDATDETEEDNRLCSKIVEAGPSEPRPESKPLSKKADDSKAWKKRKLQTDATYENTLADTERLTLEKKKLEIEIEVLKKKSS